MTKRPTANARTAEATNSALAAVPGAVPDVRPDVRPDARPEAVSQAPAAAPAAALAAALAARDRAYAPYSHFHVGAALWSRDGQLIAGCNVENASYGLAICAERATFAAAIARGWSRVDFAGLVVVGDTAGPIAPCGACRQVMLELGGPDLPVWLANLGGQLQATSAGALLPGGFSPSDLERRAPGEA
jgi:cytidine deaminase